MFVYLSFTSPFLLLLHYNQVVEQEDMDCAEPQAKNHYPSILHFTKTKSAAHTLYKKISNCRRFSSKYTKTPKLLGPLLTQIFSVCAAAADGLQAGTSQRSSATPPSMRYAKNAVYWIAEHHKCDIWHWFSYYRNCASCLNCRDRIVFPSVVAYEYDSELERAINYRGDHWNMPVFVSCGILLRQ